MKQIVNRLSFILAAPLAAMLIVACAAATAYSQSTLTPSAVSIIEVSVTIEPGPTAIASPTATPAPTNTPATTVAPNSSKSVTPTPQPGSIPAFLNSAYSANPSDPNRIKALPKRIVIPSIKVDSPVKEVGWKATEQNGELYSEWEIAEYAVGFHQNAALPGTVGNTVMSGHNNIKGEVFRRLSEVKVGETIGVYTNDQMFRYSVTQTMIVPEKFVSDDQKQKNAEWIAPTNDNRLTLVSCWPYTNNTHRVIVVAMPIG